MPLVSWLLPSKLLCRITRWWLKPIYPKRKSPLGVIDLSARYFTQYDKTGALGKLTNVPTVLSINGSSIQLGDLEIGYLSSEPATILADEQFLQKGMPDPLWQITRDVGKAFGIRVPLSYKRKIG